MKSEIVKFTSEIWGVMERYKDSLCVEEIVGVLFTAAHIKMDKSKLTQTDNEILKENLELETAVPDDAGPAMTIVEKNLE